MKIKIVNWEKYNTGTKPGSTWLRLEKSIVTDLKFIGLNVSERWLFVCLMALQCGRTEPYLDLTKAQLKHYSGLKWAKVGPYLDQLRANGLIQVDDFIEVTSLRTNERTDDTDGRKQKNGIMSEGIIHLWNESGLQKVETVTTHIRRLAREAFSELPDLEAWKDIFTKTKSIPFLAGQNKSGWKADLTWVLKNGNWGKIKDGVYSGSEIDWDYVFGRKETSNELSGS